MHIRQEFLGGMVIFVSNKFLLPQVPNESFISKNIVVVGVSKVKSCLLS